MANKINNKLHSIILDFDYKNDFSIDLINFKKSKNTISNFF